MRLGTSGGDRLGAMLNERAVCQLNTQLKALNLQFLKQGGMSISEPDGRNVGLVNIITRRTR